MILYHASAPVSASLNCTDDVIVHEEAIDPPLFTVVETGRRRKSSNAVEGIVSGLRFFGEVVSIW